MLPRLSCSWMWATRAACRRTLPGASGHGAEQDSMSECGKSDGEWDEAISRGLGKTVV